ncbi:hypothetical protein ACH4TQ_27415 [Streptomyces sp. NPDC021218]|uniref:hypothetical protein n=1 Tax=Streptomyces sp. NPDC021218 TaxID=3365119 RepID=UPI003794E7AA
MDDKERAELVWQAITQALSQNSDAAATTLQHIGTNSDTHQMYGVCCAFAEVGARALKKMFAQAAFAGPSAYIYGLQELKPGGLGKDPADTFAARFVVAYANKDRANTLALFETALRAPGTQYVESVCALLATVTGLVMASTDGAS